RDGDLAEQGANLSQDREAAGQDAVVVRDQDVHRTPKMIARPYRVKTRARRQVSAQYRKWLGRPSYTVAMGTDRTRKPWASASRRNAVSKSYRASRGRTSSAARRVSARNPVCASRTARPPMRDASAEIGRASCRERGEDQGGAE